MSRSRARQLQLLNSKALGPLLISDGPTMATGPYRSALLRTPAHRSLPKPTPQVVSHATLIHRPVQDIRARSTAANPICIKCGSTSHMIQQCRNAQLCFVCNKFGHKGKFCKAYLPPAQNKLENRPPNPSNSDLQHPAIDPLIHPPSLPLPFYTVLELLNQ